MIINGREYLFQFASDIVRNGLGLECYTTDGSTSTLASVPLLSPAKATTLRGTVFFLKGDARLSPGALDKLKTWTASWGTDGIWVLAYPSNPEITPVLKEDRLLILRSELQKLGVSKFEIKILPVEPSGQYDAVHIEK